VCGVVLSLALTAGCVGTIGDAGDTTPHRGPVPATPTPVSGPAIRGSVIDARGHAAAGATVTVTTVLRSSERTERDLKALFSLGLGCFDTQGCSAPRATGVVAKSGGFALPVPHGMTDRDQLALSVTAARGTGATVETTLILPASANDGLTVAAVPLAAQPATLDREGDRARFRAPAVRGAGAVTSVAMYAVVDGEEDPADEDATDVSGGFDTRLLEDGDEMLVGHQTGHVNGWPAMFSASLVVTGHDVPASRGAACFVEGSRGQRIAQHPCGLTNGELDAAWSPTDDPACDDGPCPGTAQSEHRDVTIVLPRPIAASLLVVRGCGFTCQVQISGDGTDFGPLRGPGDDTSANTDMYVEALPGTRVAAVRVRTATGGFFDSLRQVSVFD
jgi:hypothetical protein